MRFVPAAAAEKLDPGACEKAEIFRPLRSIGAPGCPALLKALLLAPAEADVKDACVVSMVLGATLEPLPVLFW